MWPRNGGVMGARIRLTAILLRRDKRLRRWLAWLGGLQTEEQGPGRDWLAARPAR